MRDFDEIDALLRSALESDTNQVRVAPRPLAWRHARRRFFVRRWLEEQTDTLLDGMLKRGAYEPAFPVVLEARLLSALRFVM